MLQTLFEIVLANAVTAGLLGIGVAVVARCCRRPAAVHALWLVVFVKLITPPILTVPIPPLPWPTAPGTTTTTIAIPVEPIDANVASVIPAIAAGVSKIVQTLPQVSPQRPNGFPWQVFWREGIVGVWFAGGCTWLLLLTVRARRFHRVALQTALGPTALQQRTAQLATMFGLRTTPQVRLIQARISPLLWQIGGRPVILLPARLMAELTQAQIDGILAHELAHMSRGDHWTRRFVLGVTALYWWHPLVWWGRRGMEQAAEQCCDAVVTAKFPDQSRAYAAALLQTIDFLTGARPQLPVLATTFGQGRSLKRRFTMILDKGVSARLTWKMRGVLAAAGLLVLAASPWVAAEEDAQKSQDGAVRPGSYQFDNASLAEPQMSQPSPEKREQNFYHVQWFFMQRSGNEKKFVSTHTGSATVQPQQQARLDSSKARRYVYIKGRTAAESDYLVTEEIPDGWQAELTVHRGRDEWVTVDATLTMTRDLQAENRTAPNDGNLQSVRVQEQKLRIIKSVQLGERIRVPFDSSEIEQANKCVEFLVQRQKSPTISNENARPSVARTDNGNPAPAPPVSGTPRLFKDGKVVPGSVIPSTAEVRELFLERWKAKHAAAGKTAPALDLTKSRFSLAQTSNHREDAKFYPLVGLAHKYTVTLQYSMKFVDADEKPQQDIFEIDRSYLVPVPNLIVPAKADGK